MIARSLDYTTAQEIAPPEYEFPFEMNGDAATFIVTRFYKQTQEGFYSDKAANLYRPGVTLDPQHAATYLLFTGQPRATPTGLFAFTRSFAKIPVPQTEPSSMFITKPDIPGTFPQVFGDFLIVKPVDSVASYDAYTILDVSADSGAPTTSYPTGGTYTLSFAGSTTASINYNDTNTTVQTRLNALTPVSNRGNVVVTGAYNTAAGFTVAFNTYAAATAAVGSLTAATGATVAAAQITTNNSGYRQTISLQSVSDPISYTISSFSAPETPITSGKNGNVVRLYIGSIFWLSRAVTGNFELNIFGDQTNAIPLLTPGPTSVSYVYSTPANRALFMALLSSEINALAGVTSRGGCVVTDAGSPDGIAQFNLAFATPPLNGGTYTITLFGDTTASINHNDSIATISTRLNALAGVTNRGGCTVSGAGFANGQVNFTIDFVNPDITSTLSVTPSGISLNITSAASGAGRTQTLIFSQGTSTTRRAVAPGHTIAGTEILYVLAGAVYIAGITTYSVDGDAIVFTAASGAVFSAAGTITEIGERFKSGYAAGASLSRIKRVTDFYLPGVTPGITTVDDIPLPIYQGDSASLLTAIFTGATSINYQVGELARWRDSPIVMRPVTTLNAATLT